MCWLCKPCNAYVGCHNNSKKPLGTLADAELREWRKKVHQKIDPIWKSGRMTRKNMYKMLNRLVNKEFHVGQCDIEMCKKILDVDFLHEKKFVRPTLERIINLRNY